MIKFRCKNCNQKISVPQIHAGKKGKCPKCKSVVVVPELKETGPAAGKSGSNDYKLGPNITDADLSFLNVPEQYKIADQPAKQDNRPAEIYDVERNFEERLRAEEAEPVGRRKLPWLIDIFLYPANVPALAILGIVIGVPLLINIFAGLVGPFAFFVLIPGLVVKIAIYLYLYWYYCECVRDSAGGGVRAPETIGTTPGIGDMFLQLLRIVGCSVFFFAPIVVYFLYTKRTDTIYWLLAGYGVFFFPMGLLAVIMFDSLTGLNPVLLIGSIFSTFFQYCGLILLMAGLGGLMVLALSISAKSPVLAYILRIVDIYWTMVGAHLLGRFYWRYQEKLNWEV
jgi:phage FluMu protein Com